MRICVADILAINVVRHHFRKPETFDIVSSTISAVARKNLSEISKMLIQISSGQLFGDSDPCLMPINSFVESAIKQFSRWFLEGES